MNFKDMLFCRHYCKCQNEEEAAKKANISEKKAVKLLQDPNFQQKIKKIENQNDNNQLRHWAITALQRLIFCSPNDTLTLALKNDQLNESQIENLNLFQIAEFKKQKDGSLEFKFFNKLEAINCLIEIMNNLNNLNQTNNFLNALNSSSKTQTTAENETNNR